MFPKRRSQPSRFQAPSSADRFPALWISGVGSLIALAVGIVTAKSAKLAPIWVTLLMALGVLLLLGLAVPSFVAAVRSWRANQRLARGLRAAWTPFRHEVDERRWLFTSQHTHSLPTLLLALRSAPQDQGGQLRLNALKWSAATCASLDRMRVNLDALVDVPWPGVTASLSVIGLFEDLIALPDHSGWYRELATLAGDPTDGKIVTEWLDRYRGSLEQYGRWARDRNRELEERVFREHFL